jgi:RNA recognition motif-containing protein
MNLFVAKLNSGSTSEDLQKLFAHYGEVSSVRVILDKETGNSKRYGFVEMPNEFEAKEALKELNETEFQQSIIVVKESQPRENQPGFNGPANFSQKRTSRPENRPGQGNFSRSGQSQRNYNRGNDSRGNYSQRSYENRN